MERRDTSTAPVTPAHPANLQFLVSPALVARKQASSLCVDFDSHRESRRNAETFLKFSGERAFRSNDNDFPISSSGID
ncbi:unnamed protein product [Lasius platythorax]|uniref:Uncharacterized protein n=1 Tax=Lasius platythorax TaxID=488582 RepID=A0AAV2N5B5_9HYME